MDMFMKIKGCLVIVLADFIISSAATLACLTWTMTQQNLVLECTVKPYLPDDVTFYNQYHKKIASCFEQSNSNCFGYDKQSFIYQSGRRTMLVMTGTLEDFTGTWRCTHGMHNAYTIVSTEYDHAEGVDINVTVTRQNDTYLMNVICSSCLPPFGNVVNILYNNTSIDYVRYWENKCIWRGGKCKQFQCRCFPEENTYEWSSVFQYYPWNDSVSCEMKFYDTYHTAIVTVTKKAKFTKEGYIIAANKTVVIPDISTEEKDDKENIGFGVAISFSVIIVTTIVVLIVITVLKRRKRRDLKKTPDVPNLQMTPLIDKETNSSVIDEPGNNTFPVGIEEDVTVEDRKVLKGFYIDKIAIPKQRDEPPINIRGLMLLKDNIVAVIDYNNKNLTLFTKDNFKHIELNSCPRAIAKISDTTMAISFDMEYKIRIYEVSSFEIEETIPVINLDYIGKPFDIAYSDYHFAIECGEGSRGCIAILSMESELKNRIEKHELWYFTGNTIRLELNVERKEVYVSAIGKNAVYCINFSSEILFKIEIQFSRDILVLKPFDLLLIVSKNNNDIFAVDDRNIPYVVLNPNNGIDSPKYISYIWHENDLLLCVTSNNCTVKTYLLKYEEATVSIPDAAE